jgi:hypothetical protein
MRKAVLLAMATAVAAMLTAPGTAGAAWTKHHLAIASDVEVEITGTEVRYEGSFGGYECDTISKVDFTAGTTTGTVTTFVPDGSSTDKAVCRGTGGQGHCTVHDFTPHGLPWTVHTAGIDVIGSQLITTTISITTGTIETKNTGVLCFSPDLTPGTVTLLVPPGEASTTSTATLSGTLQSHSPSQTVTVGGTVHVLGTITYGA